MIFLNFERIASKYEFELLTCFTGLLQKLMHYFCLWCQRLKAVKCGYIQCFFICCICVSDTDSHFYAELPSQILNESIIISVMGDL